MQSYNIEIKTHDDRVWYLEAAGKGLADWTPDSSKAKVFKTLNAAIAMYDKTARFAVCKSSCVNAVLGA